jgi:hypothetical protein
MTDHIPEPHAAESDPPLTAGEPLAPECLRCQTVMSPGFQFDIGYGVIRRSKWVEGSPQRTLLSGEVKSAQAKQGVPITMFRCPACGYLESYAFDEG